MNPWYAFQMKIFLPTWAMAKEHPVFVLFAHCHKCCDTSLNKVEQVNIKLSIRAASCDSSTLCLGRECELTFAVLGFYNHELFHVSQKKCQSSGFRIELLFKYQSYVAAQNINDISRTPALIEWKAPVKLTINLSYPFFLCGSCWTSQQNTESSEQIANHKSNSSLSQVTHKSLKPKRWSYLSKAIEHKVLHTLGLKI